MPTRQLWCEGGEADYAANAGDYYNDPGGNRSGGVWDGYGPRKPLPTSRTPTGRDK